MRRTLILSLLVFSVQLLHAQADSIELKAAVQKLEKALINRDSVSQDLLLDKKLSYGHSNGWIQTKEDVWKDGKSGKMIYTKIETDQWLVESIGKEWATVRTHTKVAGAVNGNAFDMTLHILQVWKKEKKGWQLVARQSTKLN